MLEYSLLQRVALGDEGAQRSLDVGVDKLRQSVRLHLQNLFNVRYGSVVSLPEYGLPDFNDLDLNAGYMQAVKEMRKAIKDALDLYEPRLDQTRVSFTLNEDDPTDLRFEIVAKLVVPGSPVRVKFETMMGNDGLFKVQS